MGDKQGEERQAASSVLMVRPVGFRGNPETASSNRFQRQPGIVDAASEQAAADTQIHKATLEEAGQSLVAEVKPIVVDVEGETVELTGTVEAKFQQWRDVIKKIHDREVGPINDTPTSSAARPAG